jgi:hypothetical protein
LAFLLAFVLAFSDMSFVKADSIDGGEGQVGGETSGNGGTNETATVYRIWGNMMQVQYGNGEIGEEPDPDTLEIADACPEGKILVAKYITGGSYIPKLTIKDPTDAEVALLMNNVTINLSSTGENRIKRFWNWMMAGDCTVIFDNMTASTKNGKVSDLDCFPEYTGNVTVEDLLSFYRVYPYDAIMDEKQQNVIAYRKEPRYDVTGEQQVDGDIYAGRVVVNAGANLIMNAIEDGDDDSTRGNQIQATQIEVNGTLTMGKPSREDAMPQIRVYAGGALTLGTNGVLNVCDGTELILHDGATVSSSLKLYEKSASGSLVSHTLTANHGTETFIYSEAKQKWIKKIPTLRVDFEDWRDEKDNPRATLSVNDVQIQPGQSVPIQVNVPINISFTVPEERANCQPAAAIWLRDGDITTWAEDANHRLVIENNSFTYTPTSDDDIQMNVWWSEYDRFGANWRDGELLVETNPDGGSVVLNMDVSEENTMNEPNGYRVKNRIQIKDLTNDSFTITMTPDEGRRLCNVCIWMQDHEERYTIKQDTDPKDGWQLIDECEDFTEQDGVYTYTFHNVSKYQKDYIGFNVWFEDLEHVWPSDGTYNMNYWFFDSYEKHDGKVYVKNDNRWVFLEDHSDHDFTSGETLQFQVEIPVQRTGCEPVIEVRTNVGEYFSTFDNMDQKHKIALTKVGDDLYAFSFTPATDLGFEVKVHWSDYDYAWYDHGDFILYTGHWGDGTVEPVGNDKYRFLDEPSSDENGTKYWYHNDDLTTGEGVSVVITPAKGWHVNGVRLIVNYLDEDKDEIWEEYVNQEEEAARYLFEEGSPFTEKNGAITLKLPEDAKDSFFRVEVTFGENTDASIGFGTGGASVGYRFASTEDFIELSEGEEIDGDALAGKDEIQLRFTAPEDERITGIRINGFAEGVEDSYQTIALGADGIYTLKKGGFWKNYHIEVIYDYEIVVFDGMYRFVYDGDAAIDISDNRNLDENYSFTKNQPISFSFEPDVYAVIAQPRWREEVEVEKNGNVFQYTPESNVGLVFFILRTEEEYIEYHKPRFSVEFDNRWDDEQYVARAFVSANGVSVENGDGYSFDVNTPIDFTLSCPDDREGEMPIVEIEYDDGSDFFSSETQDAEHKITIQGKKSFRFTPTNDSNFTVRIWWSEFDKLGPDWDKNEFLIETDSDGGSVVANVTALRSEAEPGGSRTKQIVDRGALNQDSIVFTITPNKGWRLREVNVWSPNQEDERYTIRKNEDPDVYSPLNEENGFTVTDGVYTFTVTNVSRLEERHVKVEAWFDKISDYWIQDGKYYVNYGDYGYENGQPRAKVLVNNILVLPGDQNQQDFTAGVPLTFSLQPSKERAGCQPLVEIRSNLGEYLASWEDDDNKINISKDLTFTYTPADEDGFEVNVWWADYDRIEYGEDEFLVALDCREEGRIGVSKEVDRDKRIYEPNQLPGIKRIYDNSVLDEEDGLKITITPNKGYHVSKIWYDFNGENGNVHIQYVTWTPGEGEADLFAEGTGFSEVDGVVIYDVPESVMGYDICISAEFQADPSGIEINTWGGTAEYRIGTSAAFTAVSVDEEGMLTIPRSEFEKASIVQIRLTPAQGQEFKGVNYLRREDGKEVDARVVNLGSDILTTDGILTIIKESSTWPSIEIEMINWDVTYDGQYTFDNRGISELHISDNREPWQNYSFTVNRPITFSFEESIYKVLVSPNYRERFEITPENGIYSYTPTENRALRFEVYLTEEDYEYEMFQPDHENTEEFSLNYNFNVDDDVVVGTAQIVTYGVAPKRTKTHGNQTRVILENVQEFSFIINVPEGADYHIYVDGMDDEEATQAVKENNNTLVLNVSEPWNIPFVDIHVFAKRYDVHVEGGWSDPGNAAYGQTVTLHAHQGPEGQVFDKWVVTSGDVTLDDETKENATFVQGLEEVNVEATWKNALDNSSPVLLGAEAKANGITFTWKANAGVFTYAIFRKEEGGKWVKIATTTGTGDDGVMAEAGSTCSYVDGNAAAGKTYVYTARGINANGKYITNYDMNGVTATMVEVLDASSPVLGGATVGADGITVTWTANSGVPKYAVFRKVSGGKWIKIAETTGSGNESVKPDAGTTCSYADGTAEAGTTYMYTVRGIDESGKYVTNYNTKGVTATMTSVEVLDASSPVLGGATAGANGITVTWTANSGVFKYAVFRKVAGGKWTRIAETTGSGNESVKADAGMTCSYADGTAAVGTTYTYTVRGLDESGNYVTNFNASGVSATMTSVEILDASSPVLGNATAGANGITVTWTANSGVPKYAVFRKVTGGKWKKIAETTGSGNEGVKADAGSTCSYLDGTAEAGTTYTYTVRGLDEDGKYVTNFNANGVAATMTNTEVLDASSPVLGNATAGANGITVTWTANSGVLKYAVFRKVAGGKWKKVAETTGSGNEGVKANAGSTCSYVDGTAVDGTTYTYTVRGLDEDGKYVTNFDANGVTATMTLPEVLDASSPVLGNAVAGADGITVTWTANSGVYKYAVFRKVAGGKWAKVGETTGSGDEGVKAAVGSTCSYADGTAVAGTTYIYTVRGLDESGKYATNFDANGVSVTAE